MVHSGFLPARVGATVVPRVIDFGSVPVGSQATKPVIVISTSIDPLVVTDIVSSDPEHFIAVPRHFTVLPTRKWTIAVAYTPTDDQLHEATLTIYSNDPDGPITISVRGHGVTTTAPVVKKKPIQRPVKFALKQNYPNPFNPETVIEYQVPADGLVQLNIYDTSGRLVKQLVNQFQEAGHYRVKWSGTNQQGVRVGNGVYFYILKAGDFVAQKKMILMR